MNLTNITQAPPRIPHRHDPNANHTLTFIIGFSILLIFILIGLLASTFLCYILKKDVYLWEAEQRKLDEENEMKDEDSDGIRVSSVDTGGRENDRNDENVEKPYLMN
ncbi:hypothetical protein WA026_001502 [Henosepilachna vigintioctopunctata]|uniref:Uncharacterized protein n=1 Tax=Henosepilachna vigintioctopunctata TaxID=420089 RepID=A0AAW1UJW3_9CUCU